MPAWRASSLVGSFLLQISSTYRLQLSKQFRFDDAGAYAGYFASIGVAHLYCSPVLQAAPGSTHGYDVVDPTRVSEELGGEAGVGPLGSPLAGHQLAPRWDIVPT